VVISTSVNKYGGINLADLERLENKLGQRLPDDYRDYLILNNGGTIDPCAFFISKSEGESRVREFYGLHNGPEYLRLDTMFYLNEAELADWMLAIGDDPFGNKLCMSFLSHEFGSIYFWDHEAEGEEGCEYKFLSSSFSGFTKVLHKVSLPNESEIELIFQNSDLKLLKKIVELNYPNEILDDNGYSLMERAVVCNNKNFILYLHSRNYPLKNSLEIAKDNYKFFPEYKDTLHMLEGLTD